ncbi:MAG: GDP-mannose 4,6-dehydratase [Actinobacteria bacterium]|nr:GDP-mannose 4,6-dehydratase [Actinomycetota bacterium]
MKILITGIAGFVGKHLLRYLLNCNEISQYDSAEILGVDVNFKNFEVESFTEGKERLRIIEADLKDKEKVENLIKGFKPDQIFHLAAQSSVDFSWENPRETFEVNVFSGINILESVKKHCGGCSKILVACTAEEYGESDYDEKGIKEDQKIYPSNPYAISKAALDFFCTTYQKVFKLPVFITRSFNHTGPGQSERFVISDFAKQIAEIEKMGKDPVIFVGNLNVYRDFLDVRDVVRAYTSILNKGKFDEVYNVCSGRKSKISDLLEILVSYSAVPDIRIRQDKNKLRPIDRETIYGNNAKLISHTGWKPEYNIGQSLLDTLNWWRERS